MRWRFPLLAMAALAGIAAADPATPPPEAAIPAGPDGDAIRRGLAIITDTRAAAPQYAGNDLRCANCHLDAGRPAGAAPELPPQSAPGGAAGIAALFPGTGCHSACRNPGPRLIGGA